MGLRDNVTRYQIVGDIFQRRHYVTSRDVFVATKSFKVGQLEGIPGRKISSGFAVEFAPFKRVRCVRLPLECREDVVSLGSGEFRGNRAVYVCRCLCFESLRLDRGACTSSSSKYRKARGFPLSLSSTARTLRINLRTRDRAGTLPRVLSSFIASPSGALDRRRRYATSRASYSSKSFEHDRRVRNFLRITDVLIGQAISTRFNQSFNSKRLHIVYVKIKDL